MRKNLLPILAAACLANCTSTANNDQRLKEAPSTTAEEKIIVIPPIKDTSSIYKRLHPFTPCKLPLPHIPQLFPDSIREQLVKGPMLLEYTSDTVKLHIKGDSCWLEYISAGKLRAQKKDGTYQEGISVASETTDRVPL